MESFKNKLIKHIQNKLDEAIDLAQHAVSNARESRDRETKSTAGDKHETGRAMSQQELDTMERRLAQALQHKLFFERIDFEQSMEMIQNGCLLQTDKGTYLFSVGLGRIELDDGIVYAVSMASPIGQAFLGKNIGDRVDFQGRSYEILELH